MSFKNIQELTIDYYNNLMDFRGSIQGKGLECGHRVVLQKIGTDLRQDYTNIGSNLRDFQRVARGSTQRIEKIMDNNKWSYTKREVKPITATMIALTKPFCSKCKRAGKLKVDYKSMSDEKCFTTLLDNYYKDQRRSLVAIKYYIGEIERNGWTTTNAELDVLDEINQSYGVILYSYGCAIGTTLSAEMRRNHKITERDARRKIAKPLLKEAPGYGFNRKLCDKCKKNIIKV